MSTVFIGGSRSISRMNSTIRERLDDLMCRGCLIFIGDANGADKAVQKYLADHAYKHVVVYCVNRCRNNIGSWQIRQVPVPSGTTGFAYYAAKDLAMAEDAQCGVMLWDGQSKGTLNNIQNLIGHGKKTLVYFAPENAFHKLESLDDLKFLLARCTKSDVENAQRKIKEKLSAAGHQLSLHGSR
jgi:hypothetical protein